MSKPEISSATVLFVEADILIRMSIAAYLRECGYRVIEASDTDEASAVLRDWPTSIDVLLLDTEASGSQNAFALAQWTKTNRAQVKSLVVGSPHRVAVTAGELCEEGPQRGKPYDPQLLHDEIRRLLAASKRNQLT